MKFKKGKYMKNSSKSKTKLIRGIVYVLLVICIIVFVFLFTDKMGQDSSEDDTNVTQNSESQTSTDTEEDTEGSTTTEESTNTEESTDTEESINTEESTNTEEDKDTEDSTNSGTNNVPSDFASLSNNSQNWGPGGDRNELNQYYCCLSNNKKYDPYDAYFMVEDSKYIYLTMDEGYEYGYTPAILDTLKVKNVKVVFFVTSQFVKKNPELVQRMIDEGHIVGNHSTSHPSKGMPSLSIEAQKNDIMGLHNYVKDNFGYEMNLFRNPAGIFSEQSLAVTKSLGYKSIFWSFAYLDYDTGNQPEPTKALNKMIKELHPGAIYLLHAVSATNTEVLGDFIDQARAAGYEFAVLE
jgi:delta-lactam-biosynthetic de-N-acetylase